MNPIKRLICLIKKHPWSFIDKYSRYKYLYSIKRCTRCGKKEYYGEISRDTDVVIAMKRFKRY